MVDLRVKSVDAALAAGNGPSDDPTIGSFEIND